MVTWACLLLLAPSVGCTGVQRLGAREFHALLHDGGSPGPGDLVATFFATTLGDAILLELPSGATLLVDAGVGWQVGSILRYLEARGIGRLDGLLLTHPHMDHYGGMRALVEAVPVGAFYCNGVSAGTSAYAALEAALAGRGVPTRALRRGDRLDDLTGPGATIEVLYPDEPALSLRDDLNCGSVVLRVTHGRQRLLLMGDAEAEEEERLLALDGAAGLKADVLKLGHHASFGSGTPAFLRAVHPRVAIAQGTEFLDVPLFFPRPCHSVRRGLGELGVPILTTYRHGAVQVVSTGASLRWRTVFGSTPRRHPLRAS
ncbi:MAG: MBL fold metallo-hydrolase [Planctomycetes bacterium]|nr:MBL fold metallo-hydrolase [Planctomycetota bacterium]